MYRCIFLLSIIVALLICDGCTSLSKKDRLIAGSESKEWFVKRRWHITFDHSKSKYTFRADKTCDYYHLWDGKWIEHSYGDVEVDKTWKLLTDDSTIEIHNDQYKILRLDNNHFNITAGDDTIFMFSDTTKWN